MNDESQVRLTQAESILSPLADAWERPQAQRLDARLSAEKLGAAVGALERYGWGILVTITALDDGPEAGTLELLYHFAAGPALLTLRVRLPRDEAEIESVCNSYPYASPFEREAAEMMGIRFINTPDPSHLFLPDDWPEGVYPLRKDAHLPGSSDETRLEEL